MIEENSKECDVTENGIIYNADKTSVVGVAPNHTNKTISLPSTVTRIEDYAFDGCTGLKTGFTSGAGRQQNGCQNAG